MASCESTGRELSYEWSHHRISSIDSKVRVTLQNPSNTLAVKGLRLKEPVTLTKALAPSRNPNGSLRLCAQAVKLLTVVAT